MAAWPLFCLGGPSLGGVAAKGHPSSPNWENKAALNRRSRVGEAVGLGGLGSFLKGQAAFIALARRGRGGETLLLKLVGERQAGGKS